MDTNLISTVCIGMYMNLHFSFVFFVWCIAFSWAIISTIMYFNFGVLDIRMHARWIRCYSQSSTSPFIGRSYYCATVYPSHGAFECREEKKKTTNVKCEKKNGRKYITAVTESEENAYDELLVHWPLVRKARKTLERILWSNFEKENQKTRL